MMDVKIICSKDYEKLKKQGPYTIFFGFHDSPFGKCLVGLCGDRICHYSFVDAHDSVNLEVLRAQWPGSSLIHNEKLTIEVAEKIFDSETELKILLKGTPFELKVWKALVGIPKGETVSYEDVATASGCGRAVRAVANAVAKNPVAYLVPCHRVIKKDGSVHKYRWGSRVKKKILEFEKCNRQKTT